MKIPFNKPYFSGNETDYMLQAVKSGKISGNGEFTKKCHNYFESVYDFEKVLLTTSCTDALEMAAILINIQPGDEVIIPSYTFVSTANAFVLRGAKIVFADVQPEIPNINPGLIESLITSKTKAIIIVHYAGIACELEQIMAITKKHNLFLIEDAAHSIDSFYKEKRLGSYGHLAAFSFHETKNIMSGEGGMLVINDKNLIERAEIIWEKGTNRTAFQQGKVEKYGWKDVGSSFLPSDLTAAVLFAQLENIEEIQAKRKQIWQYYFDKLIPLHEKGYFQLPVLPNFSSNNGHLFYILTKSKTGRDDLIAHFAKNNIQAVFHYLPLHSSDFYSNKHDGRILINTEYFSDCLLRLPLYFELNKVEQDYICEIVIDFFENKS